MIHRWRDLRTDPPMALLDPVGARMAVRDSRQRLNEEKRRSHHVNEVTASLKELQEKNHFADLLTMAMSAKPKENPC